MTTTFFSTTGAVVINSIAITNKQGICFIFLVRLAHQSRGRVASRGIVGNSKRVTVVAILEGESFLSTDTLRT